MPADEIEPVWDWNVISQFYTEQKLNDEIEPVWDWNKYKELGGALLTAKTKSNQCGIETAALHAIAAVVALTKSNQCGIETDITSIHHTSNDCDEIEPVWDWNC